MQCNNVKPYHILLVEDNLPDIVLTEKAFARGTLPCVIRAVRDGEEAIAFLKKQPPYVDVFTPHLILLDINLPKKSGYEVLQEIKKDANLMAIPVLVLTSSDADQDIVRSYSLHANSYLVKPHSLSKFVDLVHHIEAFWLNLVKLPK